jgi:hypothetical protein
VADGAGVGVGRGAIVAKSSVGEGPTVVAGPGLVQPTSETATRNASGSRSWSGRDPRVPRRICPMMPE